MVKIVVIFSLITVGLILATYQLFLIVKAAFKSLKNPPKVLNPGEESAKVKSSQILEDKEIRELVSNIVRLEQYPESEACRAQASILKAKLKLKITNPVMREMLKSILREKNNI
tara:strand:+ start:163 stop:504 length:342 start_codon:yes stop_codon:yes gene_type:complete